MADGVEFDAAYEGASAHVKLPIPGHFSVENALNALGMVLSLGMPLADAAKSMATATGVKGRVEVVPTDTDYTVLIDYAHSPDGVENVLKAVRGFAKGRVVALFGCGGDRDRTKRPKMGKIASDLADFCVVTSDNPRTEEPKAIIDDILEGMKDSKTPMQVIVDRPAAIHWALEHAQKDDIIVLNAVACRIIIRYSSRSGIIADTEYVQRPYRIQIDISRFNKVLYRSSVTVYRLAVLFKRPAVKGIARSYKALHIRDKRKILRCIIYQASL